MEKKLKALFEYQRFENNSHLAKLIQETESRYAQELSDDDLDMLNAAGEFEIQSGREEERVQEPSKSLLKDKTGYFETTHF